MDLDRLKQAYELLMEAEEILIGEGLDPIAATVDLAAGEIQDLIEADDEKKEEETYE